MLFSTFNLFDNYMIRIITTIEPNGKNSSILMLELHRKLKHIPKYTVSGPNEGNKTNVFELYCYLQMNGSLKVQMFFMRRKAR